MPSRIVLALSGAVLTIGLTLAAPPRLAAAASLSGAYLAAIQADIRNDYPVAADYYRRALFLDPDNLGTAAERRRSRGWRWATSPRRRRSPTG